jgi:hypothetical protein
MSIVSPRIFLTLWGVKNSPKDPVPHKKRLEPSSEIAALKLPAYTYLMGR